MLLQSTPLSRQLRVLGFSCFWMPDKPDRGLHTSTWRMLMRTRMLSSGSLPCGLRLATELRCCRGRVDRARCISLKVMLLLWDSKKITHGAQMKTALMPRMTQTCKVRPLLESQQMRPVRHQTHNHRRDPRCLCRLVSAAFELALPAGQPRGHALGPPMPVQAPRM